MAIKLMVVQSGDKQNKIKELNSLYEFFTDSWSETFQELGQESLNFKSEFSRFSTKVGIFIGDQPIAFHAYTYFDLRLKSDREHSYFDQIESSLVSELLDRKIYKVATIEYMIVDKKYRKIAGHTVGEILGGFSAQYFQESDVDAAITITRNNRGVNKMCEMYGGLPLRENLSLHNVEVNVMYFIPGQIKDHPSKDLQRVIDSFKSNLTLENEERIAA